jgi:tetratricopeptide (TPR) repeat protein
MRLSPLAVVAAIIVAGPAAASVQTMGGGYAKSCYAAAESHFVSKQGIDDCNLALAEEALPVQDRVATLVNRGILYLRRHDVARADADFDAALEIDPNQAEAWLNKAIARARFGKSTDALPMLNKAFEHGTRKPAVAYFVRAMAYEERGNYPAAYRDLQRAHQLDPNWAEPTIELKRYKVRQL